MWTWGHSWPWGHPQAIAAMSRGPQVMSGGTCWGGVRALSPAARAPTPPLPVPKPCWGARSPPAPLGGTFGSCSCHLLPWQHPSAPLWVPPGRWSVGRMLRLGGLPHSSIKPPAVPPAPGTGGDCSCPPPAGPLRRVLGAPPPLLPSGRAGAGGGDSSGLARRQPPGLAQTIAAPARLPGAGDARSSRSLRSRSAARPRLRRGTRAPAAAPSVARRAAEGAAGSCCLATGQKPPPKPPQILRGGGFSQLFTP